MTSDPRNCVYYNCDWMKLAGLEVAMHEVVFLSAVILLHQVCDASEYQKWTAQSHYVEVIASTFMQHRSVYKHVSTLHVLAQMYAQALLR